MDLLVINRANRRRECKLTVLRRPDGVWHATEVAKIINGLMTETNQLPSKPEYLVLYGHHTKADILSALGGGLAFKVTQVTGLENKGLPFTPSFI